MGQVGGVESQTFLGIGAQVVSIILAVYVIRDTADAVNYPSPRAFDLMIGYIIVVPIFATAFSFLLTVKRTLEIT